MPSSFVDSRINQNLEVATEYFRALVSKKTTNTLNKANKSAGSIGFIPYNISFTMDGISGIKIYNELSLDTNFLPPGYSEVTNFIVTGVDHKIQNGDWETNINVTLIPRTDPIDNIITSSLSIFGQIETAPPAPTTPTTPTGPGSGSPIIASKSLKEVLIAAGYPTGTFKHEFALIIGTKEGYVKGSSNRPSRNNNPGNLAGSDFKDIDPGVVIEPPNAKGEQKFAKFSTPELGAKALVERKIKTWANGNYPGTIVNGPSAAANTYRSKWGVPNSLKGIAGANVKLTLEQFMYIYAPPSENNTEGYLTSVINALKGKYPTITRTSRIIDFINL
jgi:hypothetical protein